MRKPDEFKNFPFKLFAPFGPFNGITRWDARYDDGDSLWFWIDQGFSSYPFQPTRLEGIDAPEIRGTRATPEAVPARDYLFELIPYNAPVRLYVHKDPEKYRRYVVVVIALNADGERICVNVEMVRKGHATIKEEWGWWNVLATCRRPDVNINVDDFLFTGDEDDFTAFNDTYV